MRGGARNSSNHRKLSNEKIRIRPFRGVLAVLKQLVGQTAVIGNFALSRFSPHMLFYRPTNTPY